MDYRAYYNSASSNITSHLIAFLDVSADVPNEKEDADINGGIAFNGNMERYHLELQAKVAFPVAPITYLPFIHSSNPPHNSMALKSGTQLSGYAKR